MLNFSRFFLVQETNDLLAPMETDIPICEAHDPAKPWSDEEFIATLSKEDQKRIRKAKSRESEATKKGTPIPAEKKMPPILIKGQPNMELFPWLEREKAAAAAITQARVAVTPPPVTTAAKNDLKEFTSDRYRLEDIYTALMNLYEFRRVRGQNANYNATSKYGRMILGKLVEAEVVKGLRVKAYNVTLGTADEDKAGIDAWINDPLIGGKRGMQLKFRSNNENNMLLEMAIVDKDLFRWLREIEALKEHKSKKNFFDTYLLSKKMFVRSKGEIPLLGKDMYHRAEVYASMEPHGLAAGKSPVIHIRWMPVLEHIASGLVVGLLNQIEEWRRNKAKEVAERRGEPFDEANFDPGDFATFDYFPRVVRGPQSQHQRDIVRNVMTYAPPGSEEDGRKKVGTARVQQDPFDPNFIKILVHLAPDIDLKSPQILAQMGTAHPSREFGAGYEKYDTDVTIDPITNKIEDALDALEQMHIQKLRNQLGDRAKPIINNIQKGYPDLFDESSNGEMKRRGRS